MVNRAITMKYSLILSSGFGQLGRRRSGLAGDSALVLSEQASA